MSTVLLLGTKHLPPFSCATPRKSRFEVSIGLNFAEMKRGNSPCHQSGQGTGTQQQQQPEFKEHKPSAMETATPPKSSATPSGDSAPVA
ncbi:unnamed protein product [Tuber aestivum]|uniref:Uncharacterized protein n=1 Tax=Tuber aestivum TaxID=59557 RepID=A0A292Q140_9PEZI|nr:unnamed protein product [Tuber aestivum]